MAKKPTYEELEQRVKELETESFELKRNEEDLKHQKRRLESLIEYSSLAIVTLDEGHNIISCNRDFEKLFYFSESDMVGRNLDKLIAGQEYIEDALSYTKETLRGKAIHGSGKRQRKDGAYIDVEFIGVPVIIDEKVIGAYGIYQDTSERKQAEDAIRQSEERYRTLIEESFDGIFIQKGSKIIFSNRRLNEMLGYEEGELVGLDHWHIYHPDYQQLTSERAQARMRGEKVCTHYEVKLQRKDGAWLYGEIGARVIDLDGEPGIQVWIRDITDRKQAEDAIRESEEKYRTILESIEDGYFEVDIAGNFTFLNDSLCKIFGLTEEELIGKHFREFADQETGKKGYKTFNKVYTTGKPDKGFDWEIIRKDGSNRYVDASVSLRKDSEGQPIGFQGIIRDITEKQLAEEEKKKLEAQLLRAQKMEAIGTLAGGVAHDLNNVLSAQVSYPDLILMDLPKDSPLRKPILTIQQSGQKAAAIVQDLLTLARRGVVATEVTNLNQILDSYLRSPECEKLNEFHPDIKIECNLETHLLNIMGSPVHLFKTVMNLFSNSAEAMPHGGNIFVSTESKYIDQPIRGYDEIKEGDYVVLKVSDTGAGISSGDLDRIFEPFYTKKVMGRSGTGLGMAVVWGTVKDHKGYIDVQSTKGKETTFTLYFPVTRKEMSGKEKILPMDEYMGKGESILLVDDVEDQREIASRILNKLGYSVTTVSSGEEAVDYMKDNSADLLVLDMIMDPGIDGFETYKRILELHPGQKALIASGFSETQRVKEAQRLGAGKYIKKPYTLEKIGLSVKEELEK